jgi:hypothetical protein
VRALALRGQARWIYGVPLVTGALFAGFLAASGIPVLRHDWSWVAVQSSYASNLWSSLGGWASAGIGNPRPYPTDYLLASANIALVSAIGTLAGYVLNVFLIGAATAAGAVALVRRFSLGPAAMVASATFATFNPWVYNKVVAGHIYMVLAYAAAMLLIAEMSRERPSPYRTGLFLLLTMQSLQFFLPALCAAIVWTIAGRRNPAPIAVVLLASMPIWVGVTFDRAYLLSIPYLLPWQSGASIAPAAAVSLGGYFALYAQALPWVAGAAAWCVAVLAAAGAVVALIQWPRKAVAPVVATIVVWLLVCGTKGPAGAQYLWLIAHVPESGIYRELYDAVGFLAIAYVVACAVLVARFRLLAWFWAACGIASVVAWFVVAPATFWVSSSAVPHPSIDVPPNSRYALMPPLQPLIAGGRGSGLDPDAIVRPGNVVPLNTGQFSFPETPALVRYAFSGDARWLQALSVAAVVDRRDYQTDYGRLSTQLALPSARLKGPAAGSIAIDAVPELALLDVPSPAVLPGAPWENSVFFGDARDADGPGIPQDWRSGGPVVRVVPSSRAVLASEGWVDIRSAFVALPQLAQALGGAITTDPDATQAIDGSLWTLAFVRGSLDDQNGTTLAGSTGGYRWLPPLRAPGVRCKGLCAIVAQTGRLPVAMSHPVEPHCDGAALTFALPFPWLALGELPASSQCLLRYNVRFDPHWSAFAGGTRLGHVAVNSTTNGWIVPAHTAGQKLVIVESVACAQFVFQALAILTILALAGARGYALLRGRAARA